MATQTSVSKERFSAVQVVPEHLLSAKQLVTVSALGILFWFVFALIIRFSSGTGVLGGLMGVATFLLSIPVGWLLVVIIARIAGLSRTQLISGVGVSLAAATLCDGVSMTWTTLYGSDVSWSFLGAAYILWGVGVIFFIAYIMAATSSTQ